MSVAKDFDCSMTGSGGNFRFFLGFCGSSGWSLVLSLGYGGCIYIQHIEGVYSEIKAQVVTSAKVLCP